MTSPASYRKHQCPAPNCEKLVAYRKFACPQHWAILPTDHKAAIYAGYTIGPLSDPHIDAMTAAHHWYTEHLGATHA